RARRNAAGTEWLAAWVARRGGGAGADVVARQSRACMDHRRSGEGRGDVAYGARGTVLGDGRRSADAVPHAVAFTACLAAFVAKFIEGRGNRVAGGVRFRSR